VLLLLPSAFRTSGRTFPAPQGTPTSFSRFFLDRRLLVVRLFNNSHYEEKKQQILGTHFFFLLHPPPFPVPYSVEPGKRGLRPGSFPAPPNTISRTTNQRFCVLHPNPLFAVGASLIPFPPIRGAEHFICPTTVPVKSDQRFLLINSHSVMAVISSLLLFSRQRIIPFCSCSFHFFSVRREIRVFRSPPFQFGALKRPWGFPSWFLIPCL